MLISILTEVCATVKTTNGCGPPYQKFMMDNCKKTCELCGKKKTKFFSCLYYIIGQILQAPQVLVLQQVVQTLQLQVQKLQLHEMISVDTLVMFWLVYKLAIWNKLMCQAACRKNFSI